MRKLKGIMILLLTIICFLPICHSEEIEASTCKKSNVKTIKVTLGKKDKEITKKLNAAFL